MTTIQNSRDIIINLKELENKHRLNVLYLTSDKKEGILKMIIRKIGADINLTNAETEIKRVLDKNIMFYKTDVYYKDPINYNNVEKVWGYKIAKNNELLYYKLVDGNFITATDMELTYIKKSFNKKLKKKQADVIGYLEEKRDVIYFKIKDNKNPGTKKTQVKTGSVCGNDGMKKEKITNYILNVDNDKKLLDTYFNKGLLCKQLEVYLLNNDKVKKSNSRWFFTLEEAIEYKINKK